MSERDKIISELGELVENRENGYSHKLSYTAKRWELELVAGYILADRSRIVDPIRDYSLLPLRQPYEQEYRLAIAAINESLRRAGKDMK